MDKKTAQSRLQITRSQISLLEKCVAQAKELKASTNPTIYKAMIAGYLSLIGELKEEERKYLQQI